MLRQKEGIPDPSISSLNKINDLLHKNNNSLSKIKDVGYKLDIMKITEVSRRAKEVNFHCLNELVYILHQSNLTEYSYTIRLLFTIFGISDDIFMDGYASYLEEYFKDINKTLKKKAKKVKEMARQEATKSIQSPLKNNY